MSLDLTPKAANGQYVIQFYIEHGLNSGSNWLNINHIDELTHGIVGYIGSN